MATRICSESSTFINTRLRGGGLPSGAAGTLVFVSLDGLFRAAVPAGA
ncbi:MAG: hypothetical protein LBS30_04910 [Planctomycetota bacterium]|jgi:hypothetical protein|nr:hypothetical protein [Planctomycetota bacterium]